jgi:hypothetical protein
MKTIEWLFASVLVPFSFGMIAQYSPGNETMSGSAVMKFDVEARTLIKSGTDITKMIVYSDHV